jgi:hypothetical protein
MFTNVAHEDQKLFEFLVRLSLLGGRFFEPRTDFQHGGELGPRRIQAVTMKEHFSAQ